MASGFTYLVTILNLYSRKVLSFRVSNAISSEFCVEALDEALTHYEAPETFNTDQGSQFTADEFTVPLKAKDEDIYLHAYATQREVTIGLNRYFSFYNERWGHQ